MTVKYEILMPYHKRSRHLYTTLNTFRILYGNRDDYMVTILEDHKNAEDQEEHHKLLHVLEIYEKTVPIHHVQTNFRGIYNPCLMFNTAAKNSNAGFLILTNPECAHKVDIFSTLDSVDDLDKSYFICSCELVDRWTPRFDRMEDFKYVHLMWYQHSKHNNRMLHFCSIIGRESYLKIGGFDEGYKDGIAFEDDDFRETIKSSGMPIWISDMLSVAHLRHDTITPQKVSYAALEAKNRAYYEKKWKR